MQGGGKGWGNGITYELHESGLYENVGCIALGGSEESYAEVIG